MSLQLHNPPLIAHGWVRALLLLVIYITLSLAGGVMIQSWELWFAYSFALSFLLVYLFRTFVDRRPFKTIGFNFTHFYPDAIIGILLGIFLVSTGALIIYLLNQLEWVDITFSPQNLFGGLGLLIMISFSEELVFRGYVLRNLMKSFNKWYALFISAILFTLVHISNPGIPDLGIFNTFLGGLVLGICFMLTRGLWLPVFFHLSWNFMQGPVLGFPVSGFPFRSLLSLQVSGNRYISGGEYGFEGSAVCSILLALAFVAGCYMEYKKSHLLIGT